MTTSNVTCVKVIVMPRLRSIGTRTVCVQSMFEENRWLTSWDTHGVCLKRVIFQGVALRLGQSLEVRRQLLSLPVETILFRDK